MSTLAFTYYLYHTPTGKKYYGVRYRKGCKIEDLWTTYFTSSVIVKQLIKEYGKDSFTYEVRRVFDSVVAAKEWESKVQRRLRVDVRDDWLNRHVQSGRFSCTGHTEETKQKLSRSLTGRVFSEDHKNRISEKSLIDREKRRKDGWRMPRSAVESARLSNLGRVHDSEGVERMRASKRGKVRKYLPNGSFVMVLPDQQDQ